METFSGLSQEVGARLAERRAELSKTLRDTASGAEVSASHLSDIENGRSQVSLPVLLRLMKALDLTVAELLPRIGGSRAIGGSLLDLDGPTNALSHEELELSIGHHFLQPDERLQFDNPASEDLLIHVLSGQVTVAANHREIDLGPGDTLDSERLDGCEVTALAESTILTATRSAQQP